MIDWENLGLLSPKSANIGNIDQANDQGFIILIIGLNNGRSLHLNSMPFFMKLS